MKKLTFLLSAVLWLNAGAQPTWSGDIAAIMYKNCTGCHNPNGIGPYSLLDFASASVNGSDIAQMVQIGDMPPWKPDTAYQRFTHERVLTQDEKNKILDWVANGTKPGNLTQAPAPPVYPAGGILGTPDLKVTMPVYTSKATSSRDDYICIVIPSGLTKTRKIKAVEVVPGNRKIVHHTLVFVDPTGTYQSDTIGGDCAAPNVGDMVTGYAPGGQPTIFPNGGNFKTGMTMPANSNVILAMHYPEGSAGKKDSTSVHFYFYDENETGVRELSTAPLLENWLFCINPGDTRYVDDWYPGPSSGVTQDYSLLSIFPHCHLLGEMMESYAIGPNNDTTPLIRIPHWDFEWQDFYFFKNIKKLEKGSRIYGRGFYDNRSSNPHNPFNPPQQVCAGLNTTDEMFIFYFHYMPYQPGDELLNIDSLMQNPVGLWEPPLEKANRLEVYPNPVSDQVAFSYPLAGAAFVNLFIYDVRGILVRRLVSERQRQGLHSEVWNRKDQNGKPVSAGVYFYSLKIDETISSGRIIVE